MNKRSLTHGDTLGTHMNMDDFATLGGREFAYVRKINRHQAAKLMPHLGHLPEGISLFALHAADGSCMAIADTKDAVIANAIEFDLAPLSVH